MLLIVVQVGMAPEDQREPQAQEAEVILLSVINVFSTALGMSARNPYIITTGTPGVFIGDFNFFLT